MRIPKQMRDEQRWLVWRFVERGGKPTKMPMQISGRAASSTNPDHWTSYEKAVEAAEEGNFSGIGFALGDGWSGVDLDDCIVDGSLQDWAADIVSEVDSYTEISPSKKGVKIFTKGAIPGGQGRRTQVGDGAIELYPGGRYFTVTGDRLEGTSPTISTDSAPLTGVYGRYFGDVLGGISETVYELAKRAVEGLPESVDGEQGSDRMLHACCEVRRFGLSEDESIELITWYNENKCSPPWSDRELAHKWESACKKEPAPTPETVAEKVKEVEGFDLGLIPHKEFLEREYTQEFLVDRVLVEGEHFVIGGPKKALKTSILLDLAISLAGGGEFLGNFLVPEPQPVIVVSGESGGATLQRTAQRIQDHRGVDPSGNLYWGLKLPNLSLQSHLDALEAEISRTGAKLVAVDPAYLALLTQSNADGASNVFKMGSLLDGYGRLGVATKCTMSLVHHTRTATRTGKVPDLSDLAFSGFQEWARQWLILNHAAPRQGGRIQLHMVVGGSAGHGGEYQVDVDEGMPKNPLVGRMWDVQVTDKNSEAEEPDVDADREEKVVSLLLDSPSPLNKTTIAKDLGMNNTVVTETLATLIEQGRAKESVAGRRTTYEGVDPLLWD